MLSLIIGTQSFISPFSCLVVVLSTGALVSASCHIPFVKLIVMLSARASSSASHHTSTSHGIPLVLVPPLPPPLVASLMFLSLCLLLCHSLSCHLPPLLLIVMLLSTDTSAFAASTAITCLWWLIVVLLMQQYCRGTAIEEYHDGASLPQCRVHHCCSGRQHCREVLWWPSCPPPLLLLLLSCCCWEIPPPLSHQHAIPRNPLAKEALPPVISDKQQCTLGEG